MYIYVCLLVSVHLRFALRLEHDPFPSFGEPMIKPWRPSEQAPRVLQG
jgi:hypothetical protein